MKKIIYPIIAYIVVCLGVMFFIEQKYDFDWTPAVSKNKNITSKEMPLKTEEIPPVLPKEVVQEQLLNEEINYPFLEQEPIEMTAQTEISTEETNNNVAEEENISEENNLYGENPAQELENPTTTEEEIPVLQEEESLIPQENPAFAENGLVDIETLPIKVFLDIRYATTDNFTDKQLYEKPKCYLKKPAAEALAKAVEYALEIKEPFYLCIYDCYRPSSVQKIMLESTDKPGYLAKVSNHSRGMAVDLGPCDMYGQPFSTPTDFDTFSEFSGAYVNSEKISPTAIKNRTALQEVMKKAGFLPISNEWWHFDYKGAKNEEVLDIKF